MIRALFLLAAACLLALPAEAQQRGQRSGGQRPGGTLPTGVVTGTVVDQASLAVPTSSVAVWRVPRPGSGRDTSLVTGTISEADGTFRIEGIPPGRFYVDVSHVGYLSTRVEDVRINQRARLVELGEIVLAADVEQLEGVQVEAEREQVSVQIDRTVYNTADSPATAGGNATDVLETIPSVDVDIDGNISLRGSGNVAVLVNGKPAPVAAEFIAAYLQSLPAGSVERVEVIPNPSARYEPDGMSGIINIVLRQDVDRGFGGTVQAGGDSRGSYTGTVNLTYGRGPLALAGSYGFQQEQDVGGGSSFSTNRFDSPVTFLDQVEDEDEEETSHSLSLNADLALSARTTLSAATQFGLRDERELEVNDFLELNADEDPVLAYERLVEEVGSRQRADARLGLRHRFGAADAETPHSLDVEARYNRSVNDDDETFDQNLLSGEPTGDVRQFQLSDQERERDEASLEINYVRPLAGGRLEAGYKGEVQTRFESLFAETRNEETGAFEPDAGLNNTFDFEEQIHAAYLQGAREFGALGVQVGLRAETAQTTFALLNTGEDFDNDYTSLFPSAFLSYDLSDRTVLRASYSRRIERPRTRLLNPFPSLDDPSNPRIGNPRLQPEYTSSFEVGAVRFTPWGSLTLTPFLRYTTDAVQRIAVICADRPTGAAAALCGPGVIAVRTAENVATNTSYGVELIGAVTGRGALDGLRGFASVEGFRFVSDGSTSAGDFENDAFGWGGRLSASYALGDRVGWRGLDLQANVRYRAPVETAQGRRGGNVFMTFAARTALLGDQASLTARLSDPFGLAGFNFTIDRPSLFQEFERDWKAQRLSLVFQYNFGRQEQQRRDRGGERDDDFDDDEI
ncbi:MAG: TonB-dependent receptor [Bacteroidota bacterium]